MFKYAALLATATALTVGTSTSPVSTTGAWLVDTGHSDAQLVTDATTDYGKTKLNVTLGFGRVNGHIEVNNDDLAQSAFNFRFYPATSMSPVISEDGKFLHDWLANLSNHTLVCFHSKGAVRTSDGKLQTTGTLVLTRVDRTVDATPSEAYAGPVYGPPIIHRVSREATFVFDVPSPDGNKDGVIQLSGKTRMFREDYPQLLRAVVNTYWPAVVQDENCQWPSTVGEDYHGAQCTGKLLSAPGLPEAPYATNGEDLGVASGFNSIVGNHLNILVHLRLTPSNSGASAAGNL